MELALLQTFTTPLLDLGVICTTWHTGSSHSLLCPCSPSSKRSRLCNFGYIWDDSRYWINANFRRRACWGPGSRSRRTTRGRSRRTSRGRSRHRLRTTVACCQAQQADQGIVKDGTEGAQSIAAGMTAGIVHSTVRSVQVLQPFAVSRRGQECP